MSQLEKIDQPWLGIFVGHPTRFRYQDFWDAPYALGRTPDHPEFAKPESDEIYKKSAAALRNFLAQLKTRASIVGVDDALTLPWAFTTPSSEERAHFERHTPANIRAAAGWPIHRPNLNVDRIVDKTLALAHTVESAQINDQHNACHANHD
jgi:hypothetical protein